MEEGCRKPVLGVWDITIITGNDRLDIIEVSAFEANILTPLEAASRGHDSNVLVLVVGNYVTTIFLLLPLIISK